MAFDYRNIGYFDIDSKQSVVHRYKAPSMFFSIRFLKNRTPYFMEHDRIKTVGVKVFNSHHIDCCCIVHGENLKNSMNNKIDSGNIVNFEDWMK